MLFWGPRRLGMDLSFYQGKKVLVTGHTGFKGAWLVKMLLMAGAEVTGFSLEPDTEPNLFSEILTELPEETDLRFHSMIGDIRSLKALEAAFILFSPEIVFHLAAQPIVRRSYEEPVYTYETNVTGTVNVLECIRRHDCVKAAVMITTDKVYDNLEDGHAYREDERLDGYDPYSNSKSCAALAIHSYKRSFLDARGVAVSDLRAGNVIGGGDYATDRILPDCVRSALKGENVKVRNPHSVRPYQHVLEPLSAYLLIGEKTYKDPSLAGVYNVGPDDSDAAETGHIAELFTEAWGEGIGWEAGNPDGPHEANYLRLSHEKITEVFGWHPVWNVREAVQKTVEWTKAEDKKAETEREIKAFLKEADY